MRSVRTIAAMCEELASASANPESLFAAAAKLREQEAEIARLRGPLLEWARAKANRIDAAAACGPLVPDPVAANMAYSDALQRAETAHRAVSDLAERLATEERSR